MNKKKFQRVMGLFKDGVPLRVCMESIIEMSSSNTDAAVWIEKLHTEYLNGVLSDNLKLRREVKSFEDGLRSGIYSIKGDPLDEPTNTKESSNLGDNRPNKT